jgi:uncharacterized membrane protein YkvA (DUF1232 family)
VDRRIGHLRALFRFFRDRDASILGKLFVLAAVAYVVMPLDAIPDVAPVIGWLDDIGVAGLALAYLSRVIARYRDEVELGASGLAPDPSRRSGVRATLAPIRG